MVPAASRRISRAPRYSGSHYASDGFVYRPVTVCGASFQRLPLNGFLAMSWSYNPVTASTATVWAPPRSLATTCGIMFYFLLLWVLRCFSSPRSPPPCGWQASSLPGCPIRISPDQRSFAPPRGFSQLIASFIASESQGIHRLPLLTFSVTALAHRIDISQACSSRYFIECTACQRSFRQVTGTLATVENNGFEPLTLCVQSRCSSQLS